MGKRSIEDQLRLVRRDERRKKAIGESVRRALEALRADLEKAVKDAVAECNALQTAFRCGRPHVRWIDYANAPEEIHLELEELHLPDGRRITDWDEYAVKRSPQVSEAFAAIGLMVQTRTIVPVRVGFQPIMAD